MDVVYVNKGGENPELRYSLRSLKHVEKRKVWIIGGAPVWIATDQVSYVPSPQKGSPYSSTRSHIAKACALPEISDPFMLWNDDFYAMRFVGLPETMHRGLLAKMLEDFAHVKTPWARGMRETTALLFAMGQQDALSYDVHVPLVIHKEQMLEALALAKRIRSDAVHLRTLYGNIDPIGGVEIKDPKMFNSRNPFPRGPWLSSSGNTFRSIVEPVLRYTFPDPCIYEKG